MKKQLQILSFCFATIMGCSKAANAQTLIQYWNFNTGIGGGYTDTIHPIHADYSDLNTAATGIVYAEMTGTSATYSTYEDFYDPLVSSPVDYSDTVNARFGDSSGYALRLRNPSDSMYLLFYIPTTHFKNITLGYATESSSSTHGMLQQFFSYSLDSGSTWVTSGGLSIQYDTVLEAFSLSSVTFTDINANNNPKLVFRVAFGPNNTGTSGNDRIDNVTVTGDTITSSPTAVAQISSAAPSYVLYPNPVLNTLSIISNVNDTKSIAIYNILGQEMFTATTQGLNSSLDISNLLPGNYIIDIKENATGNCEKRRFIKQ